jgi:hypothetical protein
MNRIEGCLRLALAIASLSFSTALGAPKWISIGEFQAGGDVKAAAYSGPVSFCRIVCTEGSVIANTLIVLEADKRTPIRLDVRIPAGQLKEIALPDGPRNVTGFRIKDNARGKYRLEVLKVWAGKKNSAPDDEAEAVKTEKKSTLDMILEALSSGETTTTPEPAPADQPQPIATEPPPPVAPAAPAPAPAPVEKVVPPPPPAQSGGTPSGEKLPWE